jgi:cell division septum initiation protein DivIVA
VLMSSASIQDAYQSLLTEYQVEPDQLRADLTALIADLEAQGLLEIRRG